MPSTRRQKAKARKSREMTLLSYFENMDVILVDENSNPIGQELANTINGSTSRNDTEASFNNRVNSSQENEIRGYNAENLIFRMDIFAESMKTFSNEIKYEIFSGNGFLDVHDAFSN